MKTQLLALGFAVSAMISIHAEASRNLPAGRTVVIPASSSGAEIDLAGGVVLDKIIPFKISNSAGTLLFKGSLQNRVVKSASSGELHFYYRIRETQTGLPGQILGFSTQTFKDPARISTSYRVDGLGSVAPRFATRSSNGARVTIRFPAKGAGTLDAGEESKFMVIKTMAKHYNNMGLTQIVLVSGESASMKTAQPVP
jgi:hypothetical protein